MSAAFIAAVADTLLPGDSGGSDGHPPLPSASKAGVGLASIAKSHGAVFDAIAKQTRTADAFTAAAEPARIAAVQAIERAMPDAFRALLSALLADYYESASVLAAMGWRTDPPQPQGHPMSPFDASERLSRVQARAKLWRG